MNAFIQSRCLFIVNHLRMVSMNNETLKTPRAQFSFEKKREKRTSSKENKNNKKT